MPQPPCGRKLAVSSGFKILPTATENASMPVDQIPILPLAMYLGPEVMMPVASVIAAIVGYLLMFWRSTVAFMKRTGAAVGRLFAKR